MDNTGYRPHAESLTRGAEDRRPVNGTCRRQGCSEAGRRYTAGYCRAHWVELPEDLQYRWKEERTGDFIERQAAQREIDDFFDA